MRILEFAFLKLSDPIWLDDLGSEAKDRFFHQFSPDFDVCGFLPHAECSVKYFFKL
jgi:hypothetical protein